MTIANADSVNEYVDHWGCKRLTSYCIRRFRSGIATVKDGLGNLAFQFLVFCMHGSYSMLLLSCVHVLKSAIKLG